MLLSCVLRPKAPPRSNKLLPIFPGGRSYFSLNFWFLLCITLWPTTEELRFVPSLVFALCLENSVPRKAANELEGCCILPHLSKSSG